MKNMYTNKLKIPNKLLNNFTPCGFCEFLSANTLGNTDKRVPDSTTWLLHSTSSLSTLSLDNLSDKLISLSVKPCLYPICLCKCDMESSQLSDDGLSNL